MTLNIFFLNFSPLFYLRERGKWGEIENANEMLDGSEVFRFDGQHLKVEKNFHEFSEMFQCRDWFQACFFIDLPKSFVKQISRQVSSY